MDLAYDIHLCANLIITMLAIVHIRLGIEDRLAIVAGYQVAPPVMIDIMLRKMDTDLLY